MNQLNHGDEKFESEAFTKMQHLFINTFPHISREQTSDEETKVKEYLRKGWSNFL